MLIGIIDSISSSLAEYFRKTLEAKKKQLNQPYNYKESKSFISVLWDLFITAMILYFVKSILDAYVKEKAIVLRDQWWFVCLSYNNNVEIMMRVRIKLWGHKWWSEATNTQYNKSFVLKGLFVYRLFHPWNSDNISTIFREIRESR